MKAFVDESLRPNRYYMCVATVTDTDIGQVRKNLRSGLASGQRRFHFTEENDRRKRQMLSTIAAQDVVSYVWQAKAMRPATARETILRHMIPELLGLGVTELTLESGNAQDLKDRRIIASTLRAQKSGLVYRHVVPAAEPMVWIPDAIAWTYGKNANWRKELTRLRLVEKVHTVR